EEGIRDRSLELQQQQHVLDLAFAVRGQRNRNFGDGVNLGEVDFLGEGIAPLLSLGGWLREPRSASPIGRSLKKASEDGVVRSGTPSPRFARHAPNLGGDFLFRTPVAARTGSDVRGLPFR